MTPFFAQVSYIRRIRKKSSRRVIFPAALLFLAVLWYAVAANALIATSYRYSDLSYERAALSQELEAFRAVQVQASSPEMLEIKAQELGFLKIEKALYLAVPGTVVAQR